MHNLAFFKIQFLRPFFRPFIKHVYIRESSDEKIAATTLLSSAYKRHSLIILSSKSLINRRNSIGPNREPCGTPLLNIPLSSHPLQLSAFYYTKHLIQSRIESHIPTDASFEHNFLLETLSKAYLKSVSTANH